jgi:hypothetical protein
MCTRVGKSLKGDSAPSGLGALRMERSYTVQRRWASAIRRCREFRAYRRPDHGEHGGNQGKFVLRGAFFLKCS